MFDRLKSWLQPPERKASRTARLIAIESGGRARWTPRDYAALAREGYQCNAIVYRAVRLIAESIGALSFVLYEGSAELTAHPLLDLLARPNPRQDGASLLEAVSSHLLLAGNAYLEAVAIDGEAKPNARELYALRPDRMKVVPGPDGWPLACEYTVAGQTVRFDQGVALPPILQLTLFNPLDDYYGLSPLEAAAVAADTHNAAAKWNKALLDKPKGFLSYTAVDNASWTWGDLGYIASGAAGAFPASNPSDVLVDLVYAVNAGYRQNAVFVMNRKTQSAIRKFKDTAGNYLWQPPAQAGGRASLMTFAVIEAEDMPDIAANSLSIAFGDFNRGYLIVDRAGVTVLRDPFTAKPYVLFYTTKRVGGGVQDFDAIKLMKFAAS